MLYLDIRTTVLVKSKCQIIDVVRLNAEDVATGSRRQHRRIMNE